MEQENRAAHAAAKARGARVHGRLDPVSAAIVAEEKAKIVAARPAPEPEPALVSAREPHAAKRYGVPPLHMGRGGAAKASRSAA